MVSNWIEVSEEQVKNIKKVTRRNKWEYLVVAVLSCLLTPWSFWALWEQSLQYSDSLVEKGIKYFLLGVLMLIVDAVSISAYNVLRKTYANCKSGILYESVGATVDSVRSESKGKGKVAHYYTVQYMNPKTGEKESVENADSSNVHKVGDEVKLCACNGEKEFEVLAGENGTGMELGYGMMLILFFASFVLFELSVGSCMLYFQLLAQVTILVFSMWTLYRSATEKRLVVSIIAGIVLLLSFILKYPQNTIEAYKDIVNGPEVMYTEYDLETYVTHSRRSVNRHRKVNYTDDNYNSYRIEISKNMFQNVEEIDGVYGYATIYYYPNTGILQKVEY